MAWKICCACLLFCLSLEWTSVWAQGQAKAKTACEEKMDKTCGQEFIRQLRTASPGNALAICPAVDNMLGCTADVMATCDVLEAAHVAEQVVKPQIIGVYGPNGFFGCTSLGNVSLSVYAENECHRGLAECMGKLLQAGPPSQQPPTASAGSPAPQVDPLSACLYQQEFRTCTESELTNCSSAVLTAVDNRVKSEKQRSDQLYRCPQRAGEMKMAECVASLLAAKDSRARRDEVCQLHNDTQKCVEEAKTLPTLDLPPASFDSRLAGAAQFVLQAPYYCQAENPCLEYVTQCKKTQQTSPPSDPCQQIQVYDECMLEALRQCDEKHKISAIKEVAEDMNDVQKQHSCKGRYAGRSCDPVAQACSRPLQNLPPEKQDQATMCQTVDDLLECGIIGGVFCDAVTLADLKTAANNLITVFTTRRNPPCDLDHADDPALTLTACEEDLVNCSNHLFQADTLLNSDIKEACSEYNAYKECTLEDHAECEQLALEQVKDHVSAAKARFSGEPYFCDHRDNLKDIGPNQHFAVCQNDFSTVVQSATDNLQKTCKAVGEFKECAQEVEKAIGDARRAQIESTFSQMAQLFIDTPYFCTAENPCLERFKYCHGQAKAEVENPCAELSLLEGCWLQTVPTCSSKEQEAEVTSLSAEHGNRIEKTHSCTPLTTAPTAKPTTTAAPAPDVPDSAKDSNPPADSGDSSNPPANSGDSSNPPANSGDSSNPPANSGDSSNPPANSGDSSNPPANSGDSSTPPADSGDSSNPANSGDSSNPPANSGDSSNPPANSGDSSNPPANSGDSSNPPADSGDSSNPPADSGDSSNPPADSGDSSNPPADSGDSSNPPVDSGDSSNPTADSGDSSNPPADSGDSSNPPADSGDSSNPPADSGDSSNPPADSGDSSNPPADSGDSSNPPADSGDSSNPPANSGDSGNPPANSVDSSKPLANSGGAKKPQATGNDQSAASDTRIKVALFMFCVLVSLGLM